MRYLMLDHMGSLSADDHCFIANAPDGGALTAYNLQVGRRVSEKYPGGIGDVTLRLGEDFPGLELTSYLANADSMLIVDRGTAAIIQAHSGAEVEVIPFKLLNHKGRLHSDDYVLLNPIGSVECLDPDRSLFERKPDGKLIRVNKPVLASARLAGVPGLFRIKEMLSRYVFSEALVKVLHEAGCTNFAFKGLEQA